MGPLGTVPRDDVVARPDCVAVGVARVARYEETFSGEKLEIVVLADPEAESSP